VTVTGPVTVCSVFGSAALLTGLLRGSSELGFAGVMMGGGVLSGVRGRACFSHQSRGPWPSATGSGHPPDPDPRPAGRFRPGSCLVALALGASIYSILHPPSSDPPSSILHVPSRRFALLGSHTPHTSYTQQPAGPRGPRGAAKNKMLQKDTSRK
jgi:hypothetical protein